jgi:ATP-dependent exoDNAse (exonuclease V) beta subunit
MLHIYKASAGSGKTFTLARQFIDLCIKRQNPTTYASILAVTFTNKATSEMKSRILKELRILGMGEKSAHLEYLSKVNPVLSETEIRKRALDTFYHILHHYSSFKIQTIDAFFQQLIRSFSWEMKLNGAFEVEFDSEKILSPAIDLLLDSAENKPELLNSLVRFTEELIEDGGSWSIHKKLIGFFGFLFEELNFELEQTIEFLKENPGTITEIKQSIHKQVKDFENTLKAYADEAIQIMNNHGLLFEDFKGGTRSFVHVLQKISSNTLFEMSSGRQSKAA